MEKAENHRLIKIKRKFETLRRPWGTVLKVLEVLLQSFSRHSEAQQSFQNWFYFHGCSQDMPSCYVALLVALCVSTATGLHVFHIWYFWLLCLRHIILEITHHCSIMAEEGKIFQALFCERELDKGLVLKPLLKSLDENIRCPFESGTSVPIYNQC